MNSNTAAKPIHWKKTVRTARRTTTTPRLAAVPRLANFVRNSGEISRRLCLSRAEATHLLALCAASSLGVDAVEDALFAKLGDYVRRA